MKMKDSDEIKKEKNSRKFIISDSYDEMKFIDDWINYAEIFKKDKRESRYDESHPFTDSCIPDIPTHFKVDEDSSYSSVMDLYINNTENYVLSSEEEEEEEEQRVNNSCTSTIDLCDKPNLADVRPCSTEEEQRVSNSCTSTIDLCDKPNLATVRPCSTEEEQRVNNSCTSTIDLCDKPNLATVRPCSTEEESKIHLIRIDPKILEEEKVTTKVTLQTTSEAPNRNKCKINTVEHPIVVNLETTKRNACTKKIKLNSHRIIMQESKPEAIIPKETSVQESESTEPIKTCDLLREAEARTIQQNKRNFYDVPLRRFVIETEESTMLMKDIFKLYDLKTKTILGELSKRGTNGYYQKNWFSLRENFFSCFNGKKHLVSATAVPQERLGDLEHPEDPLCFLTKKYTIDLLNSRILLCKKKGKKDIFTCYSESIPAETDLVDVTNVVITNIQEVIYGYRVCLQKDNQRAEILLSCLNFCLKNNDGYRFYKPDSIEDFLKWIIAFRFRLGQIELNIG